MGKPRGGGDGNGGSQMSGRLPAPAPYCPMMTLLIGMNTSFTKKPMKPITANPIDVDVPTRTNSSNVGFSHFVMNCFDSCTNDRKDVTSVLIMSAMVDVCVCGGGCNGPN
eukprot:TRINITY_DN423_c0_g2_i1.p1 TRINITY_DN423_c0_g2~~TRINITY_DN423_c0_g2_i1.p1  ORF type:complete len:110 (-),score=24.96 TRINITY_DN423_c0_g2_i1:23-352(-)